MEPYKQLKLVDRKRYIDALKKDSDFFPNFWFKIVRDLRNGESPIILVVGKPRTGKTLTAMFWSWIFKENFVKIPLEKSIWKSIDQFIGDVLKENIKQRALIIDEAQKDLDVSAWNSKLGMALVKYNGSQAIRGNILFIILPYARWLPWVQIPAINYLIMTQGNGWSTYSAHRTRPDDFKGRSYKVMLEVKKVPMVPQEILDQKDKWEIPVKEEILQEIHDGLQKKKGPSFLGRDEYAKRRLEVLELIQKQISEGQDKGIGEGATG